MTDPLPVNVRALLMADVVAKVEETALAAYRQVGVESLRDLIRARAIVKFDLTIEDLVDAELRRAASIDGPIDGDEPID